MALVLTNPSGALSYGELFVPYCPEGAQVITSYNMEAVGARPNTYALLRRDWSADTSDRFNRKCRLARAMFPAYSHYVTTLHDCTTGQFVNVRMPLPFGMPNPRVVQDSASKHNRKQTRQHRLTRLRIQILRRIEDNPDDIQEWAASFYDLTDTLSRVGAGRLTKFIEGKLDITTTPCEHCGLAAFYLEDVRVGRRSSKMWCTYCTDQDATYIDSRSEYVDNDLVVSVDDGNFDTTLWYAEDNYHQNVDGDWYSEPQDRDDDDRDYDDDSTDELYRYHSTKGMLRGWTMAPDGQPRISTGCWAPLTIGIELEVESEERRRDTVAPLVHSLRDVIGSDSLYAEEDGSLDDESGFELIFGWSDLPSWQRAMPRIGTALKEGGVISHDAGVNYGLHVNVAVSDNICVQSAITWFINHDATAKLLFALARREPTHYCPREHGKYYPTDSHNAAVNFGNTAGVFRANTNGTNVDCNSTIASFRLFRGTINPVRLMADIEFCHSLVSAATAYSYTIDDDATLEAKLFMGFTMRYWQTHVLKNITRYPTLVNYLRHWDKMNVLRVASARRHGAFTDFAMTRFISQYPMGTLTGATHDGLDKRALALLNTPIASTEE